MLGNYKPFSSLLNASCAVSGDYYDTFRHFDAPDYFTGSVTDDFKIFVVHFTHSSRLE